MRLLVDEVYPPAIAQQLRVRGHDVEAVAARADLRALADDDVFSTAQQERRAVVTENIGDFSTLADLADQRGRPHHGLVLVNPGQFPRGNPRTIGRLVTQLERLLNDHHDDEPSSMRWWV